MARAPREPSIRFKADHNHVTAEKTIVYKAGDVVEKPSAELRDAAAGKFEDFVPEEKPADGE